MTLKIFAIVKTHLSSLELAVRLSPYLVHHPRIYVFT